MTERRLIVKICDLCKVLGNAERDSRLEREAEQNLTHYKQRLANVRAGYGDTAAITGAKSHA